MIDVWPIASILILIKLSGCLYLGHCTSFQHVTTRKCTSSLINIVLNALYCSKFLSISWTYKYHHLKVQGGKKIEVFYSCHSFVPSNFLQRLPTLKIRRFCFDKNGPPTPQKVPPKLYTVFPTIVMWHKSKQSFWGMKIWTLKLGRNWNYYLQFQIWTILLIYSW